MVQIGSGFDVCSAVFGSIWYARIQPEVLQAAMNACERAIRDATEGAAAPAAWTTAGSDIWHLGGTPPTTAMEAAAGGTRWSYRAVRARARARRLVACTRHARCTHTRTHRTAHTPQGAFVVPRRLALMLADVAGGSYTPSMVRSVLAWRDAAPDAATRVADIVAAVAGARDVSDEAAAAMAAAAAVAVGPTLWRQLAAANARVEVLFRQLAAAANAADTAASYDAAIDACSALPVADWRGAAAGAGAGAPLVALLADAADAMATARRLLAAMGDAAGVPIEPREQGALADATLRLPGVLAAGVPGAGGHDALFALVLASGAAAAAVEATWLAWPGGGVTPLPLTNGAGAGEGGAGIVITE